MHRIFLFLATIGMFIMGCGDDPVAPVPDPSMTGKWSGAASGFVVTLVLSETETQVSGSGTIADGNNVPLTISGTNVYPNVSLNLAAQGFDSFNFTGRFSDANTIPGALNGSGFADDEITFIRQ